jgi:hypothetical protein
MMIDLQPDGQASSRFMVWCEGVCPACCGRQVVIWDPLEAGSDAAVLKAGDEIEVTVREWVAQLSDRGDAVAGR